MQVTDYGRRAEFDRREIIHVALSSARPGVLSVSPMQGALGPVTGWLFAHSTGREFRMSLPGDCPRRRRAVAAMRAAVMPSAAISPPWKWIRATGPTG